MKSSPAFSLIELILVIAMILILSGALVPLVAAQLSKYVLAAEAEKLLFDIKQAQQFAMTRENNYAYYGVSFFNDLGPTANRCGYKIERYEPTSVVVPITGNTELTIVKGPVITDKPLIFDANLIFDNKVTFATNSEIGPKTVKRIIFTPDGSVTTDGSALIIAANDTIILNSGNFSRNIVISPVTGHAEIN